MSDPQVLFLRQTVGMVARSASVPSSKLYQVCVLKVPLVTSHWAWLDDVRLLTSRQSSEMVTTPGHESWARATGTDDVKNMVRNSNNPKRNICVHFCESGSPFRHLDDTPFCPLAGLRCGPAAML